MHWLIVCAHHMVFRLPNTEFQILNSKPPRFFLPIRNNLWLFNLVKSFTLRKFEIRDRKFMNINCSYCSQSQYIEVAQGNFFMKLKMRFGLVLFWLTILKKNGGRLWVTFEADLFMFLEAKNIVAFALKSCIIFFLFFLAKFSQSIVFCSTT